LISAGTVSVPSIGNSGSVGPMGTGGTITLGSNTTSTFKYTGPGETSNRTISMGVSGNIDASGTGLLKLSTPIVNTAAVTATLTGTELAS
jgi:hypothetical protein